MTVCKRVFCVFRKWHRKRRAENMFNFEDFVFPVLKTEYLIIAELCILGFYLFIFFHNQSY